MERIRGNGNAELRKKRGIKDLYVSIEGGLRHRGQFRQFRRRRFGIKNKGAQQTKNGLALQNHAVHIVQIKPGPISDRKQITRHGDLYWCPGTVDYQDVVSQRSDAGVQCAGEILYRIWRSKARQPFHQLKPAIQNRTNQIMHGFLPSSFFQRKRPKERPQILVDPSQKTTRRTFKRPSIPYIKPFS